MHKIILAITQDEEKEDAVQKARWIFEDLVNGGMYDYYTLFFDDESMVSGKNRWGQIVPIARADSLVGKKMIDVALKFRQEEKTLALIDLHENMKKYTFDEIVDGCVPSIISLFNEFNYKFCNIYGDGCECLDYKRILHTKLKGDNLWVIPADVHY